MEARISKTAESERAEPSVCGDEIGLDAALERVRRLVETSQVDRARTCVQEMEERWPGSEDVRYWARMLSPPIVKVRPGERSRPLDREYTWLREHAGEHPGCWLAVHGDRLVAADRDVQVVLRTVRQTPGAEDALLYFQGPNPE